MIYLSKSDIAGCAVVVVLLICLLIFIADKYLFKKVARTSLKDKHVVITGGSSGIGKSLAIEAVSRGAHVTLIARDGKKLDKAKREVFQHHTYPTQRVFTLSLDVCGEYDEIAKGIILAEKECGPVYMLVNCAGKAVCGKLEDMSLSDIQNLCNLNYMASILTTKAVLRGMKSRGEGRIVFVSSAAGLLGIYGFTAYSASKFALRGLAESLHMETQCHGIKVTIAYPPDTDTPGFATEEIGKPKETRLICQSGGLFQPSVVANQIIRDSLAGKFTSYIGFEGFMLVTLTAGMSPVYSFLQLITECFLLGPFRFIAAYYVLSFRRIIHDCMVERNKAKRAE